MKRIDTPSAATDKFGAGKNGYQDGNPTTGEIPTQLNAAQFDHLQEEIAHVIEATGAALDPSRYDQLYGAINTLIINHLPAMPPLSRAVRALAIKNNTAAPTTKVDITFDEAILANAVISAGVLHKAGAVTIDFATNGAGGLDVGALAASTWYSIFAVSDGVTLKGVASLSSVAPAAAVLAAYPYYMRLGSVRTAANSQLVGTIQRGRRVQYVAGGTNLTTLPLMASGTAAALAVAVASFVPPTANSIQLSLSNVGGAAGNVQGVGFVSPNSSGGNDNVIYIGSAAATSGYVPSTAQGSFILEGANVYYTATVGSGGAAPWKLFCLGWEENI